MNNPEAAEFFGWKSGGRITKSVADFSKALLESSGWTKENLNALADSYETAAQRTPQNVSAIARAKQIRVLLAAYFP